MSSRASASDRLVLGHDHVGRNPEAVTQARALQRLFEQASRQRIEPRLTLIATEGYEMQITGLVIAMQSPRHRDSLLVEKISVSDVRYARVSRRRAYPGHSQI